MFLRDKIIFSTSYSTFRILNIPTSRIPDFQDVFKQVEPFVIFVHVFFFFWRHGKGTLPCILCKKAFFVHEIARNVLALKVGNLYNKRKNGKGETYKREQEVFSCLFRRTVWSSAGTDGATPWVQR